MARVLLNLRLAIQRRSRGRGAGARAWFAFGWIGAVALGLAGGAAVAGLDSLRVQFGDLALMALFVMVFLVWVTGPVIVPALADQTVDPRRLEQYPLTERQQALGLVAGASIAPTALLTFLFASGGAFAVGEPASARAVAIVTAAVFTLLCVTASRSVQAVTAGALRSRRGRDAVVLLGGSMIVGLFVLNQQAKDLTVDPRALQSPVLEAVLAWSPPGAAGATLVAAREGNWAGVVLHLAVPVATIVALIALWEWALRQRVRGGTGSARVARKDGASPTDLSLMPFPLTAFRPGPVTAAAAQQMRYYFFRNPKAVQAVVFPPIVAAVAGQSALGHFGLLVASGLFVAVTIEPAYGAFGFDDRGVTYLVGSGAPLDRVLLGKVLAPLLYALPLLVIYVAAQATVLGRWDEAAAAFLAALAVATLALGIAANVSVRYPRNAARMVSHPGQLLSPLAGVAVTLAYLALIYLAQEQLSTVVDPLLVALFFLLLALPVAALGLRSANRWLGTNLHDFADKLRA